jgi:hypothetical protein
MMIWKKSCGAWWRRELYSRRTWDISVGSTAAVWRSAGKRREASYPRG